MKKDDIALLSFIVVFTLVVSYFAGRAIIGEPKSKPVTVETAVAVSDSYPTPDKRSFSDQSVDPTVNISIGNQPSNTSPFSKNSGQ